MKTLYEYTLFFLEKTMKIIRKTKKRIKINMKKRLKTIKNDKKRCVNIHAFPSFFRRFFCQKNKWEISFLYKNVTNHGKR